jgi:hypothetical protein
MGESLVSFDSMPEADDLADAAENADTAEKAAQRRGLPCAVFPPWMRREELPRKGSAVKGSSENPFSLWHQRLPELQALAQPLLYSRAVQRLANVTFLGILSPSFRGMVDSPLWLRAEGEAVDDGSRYDHALGVACIALDLARKLDFSDGGQRYAVAWGLTHDIATWPLSHTSEPAFAGITGISARKMRTALVLGSDEVPERYRLAQVLRDLNIDPDTLASLFDRSAVTADEELTLFKQVVHSPLTPDTLEGTWRCGVVFNVPVPHPDEVVAALLRQRRTVCLDGRRLQTVLNFWRSKSDIYHRFINREDVVLWESAWTLALQRYCSGVSLADSLELSEQELVSAVKRMGLPTTSLVVRYKEPQEYIINGALDALPPEPPVSELWRVLRREPVGTFHE